MVAKSGSILVPLLVLLARTLAQKELLKNADLEDPYGGPRNWFCVECSIDRTGDAHSGLMAARVHARKEQWYSPSQLIQDVIEPGKSYFFTAHIKLSIEPEGSIYTTVRSQLHYTYADGSSEYHIFGVSPMVRLDLGWTRIGGDFTVNKRYDIEKVRLFISAPAGVDFLLDATSLTAVPPDPDWRSKANHRIQDLRTSPFTVTVNINDEVYKPEDITIEVNMTRHHFPFGSAVRAHLITGASPRDKRYQNFFYDTFNWAVPEWSLKWKYMEEHKGNINYGMAGRAIDKLHSKGIPIHGHTLFWATEEDPDWVKVLEGDELRQAIDTRIDGVVGRFKDRLNQWDVNNEVLHNLFYEEATADPFILDYMFARVNATNPGAQTCLNDYDVVSTGLRTVAMTSLVESMKARGTPVHAVGIQSYLTGPQNIHNIKKRLDTVQQASLPIYISEFSVKNDDMKGRAQDFEDALTLYFSHPAVKGIMLWGFWDEEIWKTHSSLVDGADMKPNLVGEAFLNLLKNKWKTSVKFQPSASWEAYSMLGFHGDYSLVVKHKGNFMQRKTFAVEKGKSNSIEVNVNTDFGHLFTDL